MAASGYTPIITYNSSTTGHNPLTGTGTITTGELAINITDGNLYVGTGSGTYKTLLSLANNSSITISGNVTHAGAYTQTFTATANTSVTLPTSGTIISSVTALSGAVTGTPSSSTYLRGDGTWATVSTSSPGGSNGYVQYNNSGAFGGSANLFWDSTNNRLGIGTSSPSYPLDITADPAASIAIGQSSDDPFVWFDRSDGGSNRLAWRLRESSTRQLIFETGTSTTKYGQTFTQAMTLNNSGYLQVSCSSANDAGNLIFQAYGSAASADALSAYAVLYGTGYANSANSAVKVGKANSTNRSINAAGTVNASGADYAEYMTKAGNFTINKGDICGIDVNGKLTNVFANAISFVVKSTNPSYVGGDTWGSAEVLGLTKPTTPTIGQNESDADWATAETNYQTALTAYESQLATVVETARALVDRIAFAGQVPVNVTGATSGQYIVPVAKQDGSIGGEAVSESAMTLQQYMQSVGKVISVVNNVTTIIVKVA